MPVSLPGDNRRNRVLLWMAHQATWIYGATFLLSVAADVHPAPILLILALIGLVALIGLYLIRRYHGMTLCPLCATATPLDGPGQAQRRARSLRCAHWMWSRRYQRVYDVAMLAAIGLFFVLTDVCHVGRRAGVSIDLWIAVGAAEAWVMSVHRPLQPWCPQCHWDEGGDEELIPDPVPPAGAELVT
jgi:hypothetical protein